MRRVLPLLVAPDTISDVARRGKTLLVMSKSLSSKTRLHFRGRLLLANTIHLHPRKWAYTAHFRGRHFVTTTTTIGGGPSLPTPGRILHTGYGNERMVERRARLWICAWKVLATFGWDVWREGKGTDEKLERNGCYLHPRKRATYARFRGLPITPTTSTLEIEHVCSFSRAAYHLHPRKWAYALVFEGV